MRKKNLEIERLEFSQGNINGPFTTVDTTVKIGYARLQEYARSGVLLWADHAKLRYYSFAELEKFMEEAPLWSYRLPQNAEKISAQYGRVYIYKYESCYVLRDNFTAELYLAQDIRTAFELAVMVVHYFPDERAYPLILPDEKIAPINKVRTRLDYDIMEGIEQNAVWVEAGKAPMSNSRHVEVTLADAVSLLCGDRPSTKFLADLASIYPAAFVSAYGAPIVAYNQKTSVIGVAKSLTSLALSLKLDVKESLDNFVKIKTIGDYKIVGGWGYDLLEKQQDRVALVDFALSHCSSPSMLEVRVASLLA